jgi:hypothetical protein
MENWPAGLSRDRQRLFRFLGKLAHALLSSQVELAAREFTGSHRDRIRQGCFFIGMLANLMLRLPDGNC